MRQPCKSAAEALAEGPAAGLLGQARLLGRISSVVEAINRELTTGDALLPLPRCALQGCAVIITVDTPSHAAKLRQRATQIDQMLRERAPEVTGIRIRHQPRHPTYPMSATDPAQGSTPASARGTLDQTAVARPDASAALQFAADLAESLHESPLRDAARRLQTSLRRKLERTR